jgi:hypothetical protein
MRHVLALVVLSLSASACAVPPSPETVTDVEALTVGGPITNTSCISVWQCDPICGIYDSNGHLAYYPTNVLHRYCDDGSEIIDFVDVCGADCM